jgi:NAD(P)-dependent dehydrogenase (short-subunit alcohol dehydrogenase family)
MPYFPPIDESVFSPARFQNQSVLITGGANGIGRAAAIRCAREGGLVMVSDMDEIKGLQTVDDIRRNGGIAHFIKSDITDAAQAKKMVAETVSAFGKLDVAINNAGVMDGGGSDTPAPLHLATERYLRFTIEVNVFGTMNACREQILQFIAQDGGGSIVNIGSTTGLTGSPGTPAYVASKHAINGLTRALAVDYASHGIRCNSVNMGITETSMFAHAMDAVRAKRANQPQIAQVRPGMKPSGLITRNSTACEQAAVILFVASREASDMTGALIASDGGWTAY